jgi:hypothetical protein
MKYSLVTLCITFCTPRAEGLKSTDARSGVSRRAALVRATGLATLPLVANAADSIVNRLTTENLSIPSTAYPGAINGVDNLYYPDFMAGEWSVAQTLVDASAPLGLKFVGGPNGLESIAVATMAEARARLGIPVTFKLRFVQTKWGVAEDRLYNTKQRLDAFAGRPVVASVEYADVAVSNRGSVIKMGGNDQDPLQTTVVRFKGPAAQKTFLISHGAENLLEGSKWAGYELDRGIFALTNQNTAPPLTTDSEMIWMLEKIDDNYVQGKLRIAGYLNPNSDTLYFDARQRAVSLQDYTLDFKR